jgi:hypothetical protein
MLRHIIGLSLASLLFAPEVVSAQDRIPLSAMVPRLYQEVIYAEATALNGFTSKFSEDFRQNRLDAAYQIGALLSGMLSSFPLASSAGGFSWQFDKESGTFSRSSESFGPIFVERANTIGKHKLNLGVNYQRITFDRLEDRDLRGGQIIGYTGLPTYLGDNNYGVFFEEALDLGASTSTVSMFATFGLTNRIDVSVAIPYNRVDLEATIRSTYGNSVEGLQPRFAIPDCDPAVSPQNCAYSPAPTTMSTSGTSTGIGDILVRAKYNLMNGSGHGVAVGLDARLPTGDERELLGIAGQQAKLYVIGTAALGRVSQHLNVGYTVSKGSAALQDQAFVLLKPANELNVAAGTDVVVSLRSTITLGFLGRSLKKVGNLAQADSEYRTPAGQFYQEFQTIEGADLNVFLGSAGFRVNPTANFLLAGNVLVPLAQKGLTDKITWLLGFDYSF